jgi:hypothetical protein
MWLNPGNDAARIPTLHRYGAQTVGTDGRPDRGTAATPVAMSTAVVRDLDMREIRSLPEGWRLTASIGVTWDQQLRTADDATGIWADVIEDSDGSRHQVVKVGSGPPVGSLPRVYDAICIREPNRKPRGAP